MCDEKLRDELLAWQEGKRELHRWKLVAIGGVAALGLGLTSQQGSPQMLVLCLAPFIAAYCDALLRDYDLRIALIGFYLLRQGTAFSGYERFIETHQVGSSRWSHLGRSASALSSLGACSFTAFAGLYGLCFGGGDLQSYLEFIATLASAVTGALLIIVIQSLFYYSYNKLRIASRVKASELQA